jgi:hypothetical protein
MVPVRHQIKQNLIKAVKCDTISLVTNLPDMSTVKSLITSNKMNSKAKFNVAARLGQEAANNLKKLKQPEFELC